MRLLRQCGVLWTLLAAGTALVMAAPPVATVAVPAAGATASGGDPQLALLLSLETQSLKDVCGGRCHPVELFMGSPRDYDNWHDTVQKMIDRGANASDEQLQDIMDYLHRTLTTVNVNAASAAELGFALGLRPAVVQAIVARRAQRSFTGLEDLQSVAGDDAALLGSLAARLRYH
jgi:hypothetical protein